MSLRLIPNLNVFRPADAIETAECWALALQTPEDAVGARAVAPEPAAGAHRWRARTAQRARAPIACAPPRPRARWCWSPPAPKSRSRSTPPSALEAQGIGADVVSDAVPRTVRRSRTQPTAPTSCPPTRSSVSVEAGVTLGWERYTGSDGLTHRPRPVRRLGPGRSPVQAFRLLGRSDRAADHRGS